MLLSWLSVIRTLAASNYQGLSFLVFAGFFKTSSRAIISLWTIWKRIATWEKEPRWINEIQNLSEE